MTGGQLPSPLENEAGGENAPPSPNTRSASLRPTIEPNGGLAEGVGDEAQPPRPSFSLFRLLLGLLVSLVALGLVLYFVDLGRLFDALRLANYRLIALAAFVSFVWLLVRAVAWRTLLQEAASYRQVFFTVCEGYLLNNLLPFRLGEAARAFLLSHKAGVSFWQVFSSIIIERVLDLAFAAGLLLIALPFVVGGSSAQSVALIAGGLVIVGLATLYLVARNRSFVLRLFEKLSARWPRLNRFGGRMLSNLLNGLVILTDFSRFLRSVGWMALDWAIAILQYYLLLLAFFPDAPLLWAVFSLGAAALGMAAPSSPGAIGVLELSMVGALSVFGQDASTALAFAITVHLLQYLISGVIGLYALARDGESLVGLYKKLRKNP